ncbi:hypothetical protein Taro_014484 [Colocasia esculenta]|uniref:Uncharacterized protein n=1 Tax=Colocasia esculenta TaxID=4460 RepID=A0A843U950_COLES|nr:hypothetical protein [Colocasia esculenta]
MPTRQPRPQKHPRCARSCCALLTRRDTIATGRASATRNQVTTRQCIVTTTLSRRATGSRHDPYRDGHPRRDKVASKRGDASSNVATHLAVMTSAGRQTIGMLHSRVAHTLQTLPPWGGEHGESI